MQYTSRWGPGPTQPVAVGASGHRRDVRQCSSAGALGLDLQVKGFGHRVHPTAWGVTASPSFHDCNGRPRGARGTENNLRTAADLRVKGFGHRRVLPSGAGLARGIPRRSAAAGDGAADCSVGTGFEKGLVKGRHRSVRASLMSDHWEYRDARRPFALLRRRL